VISVSASVRNVREDMVAFPFNWYRVKRKSCDCELATHNCKVSDVHQPSRCSSCFKYKCELEELTQGLITTKKIIQLLQEHLNTYKDLKSARTSGDRSNTHVSSKFTNNWEIVTDKSRKSNSNTQSTAYTSHTNHKSL